MTDSEADREDLLDEICSLRADVCENPNDDWLHIELRYALEELSELNAAALRNHSCTILSRIPKEEDAS